MTEDQRSLNLFVSYAFARSFWELEAEARGELLRGWWAEVERAAPATYGYQIFPTATDADLLVWSAVPLQDDQDTAALFERYARAVSPRRSQIQPRQSLWGNTAQSTYSRARSAQEIDPFADQRATYLVAYPFVKTKEWYLMGREARQGMMNEHIRLGKQYTAIKQLLLYSFGLQDQEFVVVYETEDLPLFSKLVQELRSTEARRYTERDTPLITAVRRTPQEMLDLWSGS